MDLFVIFLLIPYVSFRAMRAGLVPDIYSLIHHEAAESSQMYIAMH
jgi:hypothetical protein